MASLRRTKKILGGVGRGGKGRPFPREERGHPRPPRSLWPSPAPRAGAGSPCRSSRGRRRGPGPPTGQVCDVPLGWRVHGEERSEVEVEGGARSPVLELGADQPRLHAREPQELVTSPELPSRPHELLSSQPVHSPPFIMSDSTCVKLVDEVPCASPFPVVDAKGVHAPMHGEAAQATRGVAFRERGGAHHRARGLVRDTHPRPPAAGRSGCEREDAPSGRRSCQGGENASSSLPCGALRHAPQARCPAIGRGTGNARDGFRHRREDAKPDRPGFDERLHPHEQGAPVAASLPRGTLPGTCVRALRSYRHEEPGRSDPRPPVLGGTPVNSRGDARAVRRLRVRVRGRRYTVECTPDERAGGYSVSVPDLPGCFTEGDSEVEIRGMVREAIGLWLHAASTPVATRR